MKNKKNKIGIIGAGQIGPTIFYLLKDKYSVEIGDIKRPISDDNELIDNFIELDATNREQLSNFIKDKFAVIVATPYYLNKTIADICNENSTSYFDLTEDVDTTNYIKTLAENNKNIIFMPQCGLAPGAINIIAADLAKNFKHIKKMELRVGALPLNASNNMKYYLSWSTSGLINEYVNLCDAIYNGIKIQTTPLDGYEIITIDGIEYEAFNTSGGSGTLSETFQGKIDELNYKTLRYIGHRDYIKFLTDDLNLKNDKKLLTELFDQNVPRTINDVVIVYVNVIGDNLHGNIEQKSYSKKIYPKHGFSAIQLATASGVVANFDLYMKSIKNNDDSFPKHGFVKQEIINFNFFKKDVGKIYSIDK